MELCHIHMCWIHKYMYHDLWRERGKEEEEWCNIIRIYYIIDTVIGPIKFIKTSESI